ncbi:hypothetical protein FRC04_007274 [Tulasnella sp. 424]|nr:hypothetical protein FRC04_007274 [Tulasnella sp. 424]
MADEGSDLKDQGFNGTADVTQFITFIRRKALAVCRSRDKEWMADFAATQLNGEAFVWHLDLDPAIQADWDKLQRALVERYRSNTSVVVQANSSSGTVAEAPAAAPPPSVRGIPSSPSGGSGLLEGRIRVNAPGDTGYLSLHLDSEYNVFLFGTSVSDALRVRFRPSNFVHEITIPVCIDFLLLDAVLEEC